MQIGGKALIKEAVVRHAMCTSCKPVPSMRNTCDVLKHSVTRKYRTVEYSYSNHRSDDHGQRHAPAPLPPNKEAVAP